MKYVKQKKLNNNFPDIWKYFSAEIEILDRKEQKTVTPESVAFQIFDKNFVLTCVKWESTVFCCKIDSGQLQFFVNASQKICNSLNFLSSKSV